MPSNKLISKTKPVIPVRALHLDLKGVPPTPKRLIELLRVAKLGGYNAFLMEWEDMFPWTVDTRFRCETAYTPADLKKFFSAALRAGIEIIPLVQCLGHMETPLSLDKYKHLREVPHQSDVLNPLAEGARELVEKMVEDVRRLLPNPKWFHLGGDEAWSFGTHQDTKAYIARHGKGALYLQHVEPLLDKLNAQSIRPILWHDMMQEWDGKALSRIAEKADLCVWGYQGHPRHHHLVKKEMLERFRKHHITMWGGTAYKGADGPDIDLPDAREREINAAGWAELAGEYKMAGVIATAWSRYSTHDVQCEPIDGALDVLLNVGAILHNGKPPRHGLDDCVAALKKGGEGKRFIACRQSLETLTQTRNNAKRNLLLLRETVAMAQADKKRTSSGLMMRRFRDFNNSVIGLNKAGMEMKKIFKSLIHPLWLDRYIVERSIPFQEERKALEKQIKHLDAMGYKALAIKK